MILFLLAEIRLSVLANSYTAKKDYLESHASEIQLIGFGTSTGLHGFEPSQIACLNSFNFANRAQSLVLSQKLLSKYRASLNSLKVVLILLDHVSLNVLLSDVERNRNGFYMRHFGFAETWESYLDPRTYSLVASYGLSKTFDLLFPSHRNEAEDLALPNGRHPKFTFGVPAGLLSEQYGVAVVKRHRAFVREASVPKIAFSLKKIVEEAGPDVKIVFAEMPLHSNYLKNVDLNNWNMLLVGVKELARDNLNVKLLPKMESGLTDADFFDVNYLSDSGAQKFSQFLSGHICSL